VDCSADLVGRVVRTSPGPNCSHSSRWLGDTRRHDGSGTPPSSLDRNDQGDRSPGNGHLSVLDRTSNDRSPSHIDRHRRTNSCWCSLHRSGLAGTL